MESVSMTLKEAVLSVIKDKALNFHEVKKAIKKTEAGKDQEFFIIDNALCEAIKADKIYFNEDLFLLSLTKLDDTYCTFSEMMEKKFGKVTFLEEEKLSWENVPRVDFATLKAYLLSKDTSGESILSNNPAFLSSPCDF